MVAPSSGKISRRYIDPGNLVKNDDTILTTLVSLDPIYAYFDLDERTALRLQRPVAIRGEGSEASNSTSQAGASRPL